jgi:hypothetical protein
MIRLRLYRDGVERNGGYTLSSFAQTGRLPGHGAIDARWRNLIVTPDVSLHAQRARHASAPATRRAARAAGERSAAVQGSGRAAATGSAGRPADARSGAAGCGPATLLRRAAAKVAASMGWSASISASICRTALLAVSINARCAGPMAACRRCGLYASRIDLACKAPTEHPDHQELSHLGSVAEVLRIQPCQNSYRLQSWRFWLSMGHPQWPRRRRCRRCLS